MKENFINLQKEVYDFLILRGINTENAQKVSSIIKEEDEKKLLEERFQTFVNSGCNPDDSLVYAAKELKNFRMQKKEQEKIQKQQEREQKQREKEQEKMQRQLEKEQKQQQREQKQQEKQKMLLVEETRKQKLVAFWSQRKVETDESGKVLPTMENYIRIFSDSDPDICGHVLRHNEITRFDELNGHEYTDDDFADLLIVCDRVGLPRNRKDVKDAVNKIFSLNVYNPLKEKFDSLTWDGTKRAESIFIDYLGVEDTPLNRKMSFLWLYAAVKRALEPGCKFDSVLIIQGPQGAGKSLIFERLSMGYACDNPDITTRDGKQMIHRSWIVIWDELVNLGKKGSSEAKDAISKTADVFRSVYAEKERTMQRHFVFCGTTNEENFLKDYTGKVERRFWIMKATRDHKSNKVYTQFTETVVEQVWSEVYAQYNADKQAGFERPLVLLDNDYDVFAKNQEEFKAQNVDLRFEHIKYATSLKFPRTILLDQQKKPSGLHGLLDEKYFVPVAVRGDNFPFDEKAKAAEWGQVEVFPVRVISNMLTELKFSTKDCKGVCKAFAEWYHEDWVYKRGRNEGRYYLVRKTPWKDDDEDSNGNQQQEMQASSQPVQQPVQQVSIPGIQSLTDVPDLTGKTLFSIMDKNGYGI